MSTDIVKPIGSYLTKGAYPSLGQRGLCCWVLHYKHLLLLDTGSILKAMNFCLCSFWDSRTEDKLYEDKIALNLLFVQVFSIILHQSFSGHFPNPNAT